MNAHTILVIDDDDDVRSTIVETLEDEGFSAVGSSGGVTALALLARSESKPAVILLDLMMPFMTGSEFRAAQLQDPAIAKIPVMLLTADSRAEASAIELGASACLRKPVTIKALIDAVARFAPRNQPSR
jgi:CheY-like chemotaxis protein